MLERAAEEDAEEDVVEAAEERRWGAVAASERLEQAEEGEGGCALEPSKEEPNEAPNGGEGRGARREDEEPVRGVEGA